MVNQSNSGQEDKGNGWNEEKVRRVVATLDERDPDQILSWAVQEFGKGVALACSFGFEDVSLVHRLTRIDNEPTIFYLDTDLLFKETHETRDQLIKAYDISFTRVEPAYTLSKQAELWGDELWKREPDQCCFIRKVEPLRRFLAGRDAWITGIRRDQAPSRANAEVVEWDSQFGLVKINPLAYHSAEDVWEYIHQYQVPYNPLHEKHYPSIGCIPCTRSVATGEDSRAGRWASFGKTECGLHQGKESAND
ncbi:phosphoadenylylsulfate reductase (thioredoxin) [Marininema mesophilum]|uniref:Adenosine 5'-phosphosulfate reductase n=1 Tax=Marininema mesophilum TaxID=1048340 RepID=A0A1H3BL14_9BACL|nr:phosphoadenylyl-sulfate reductase [Marininema mesophilum]SDX42388.1 phosphoadenylylsulfate reductase (thioredoxin) [Marininema mesophilum]